MRKITAFIIVLLLISMLAGCKRGEEPTEATAEPVEEAAPSPEEPTPDVDEATAEEVVPEETPPAETSGEEEETANDVPAEETQAIEDEGSTITGNATDEEAAAEETSVEEAAATEQPAEGAPVTVLEEKTEWIDLNDVNNITRAEATSFFSNVFCVIGTEAEEAGYTANVQSDDTISFTVTNNDEHEYYLPIEKPEDSDTSEGMRLLINGRRVRDSEERCGSKYVDANGDLTCNNIRTVIKSGTSIQGMAYSNKLEASTRYYRTQMLFTC